MTVGAVAIGSSAKADQPIDTYKTCLIDAAIAAKADVHAAPTIGLIVAMGAGDIACTGAVADLVNKLKMPWSEVMKVREEASDIIEEKLDLKGAEAEARKLAWEQGAEARRAAREQAKAEQAKAAAIKAEADAAATKAWDDEIKAILRNDPNDAKYKIQSDADWGKFKVFVAKMGKHIGWKRMCARDPYDAEMRISLILIDTLTESLSMKDMAQTIFVESASERPDCNEPLEALIRHAGAMNAYGSLGRFRRTGSFQPKM